MRSDQMLTLPGVDPPVLKGSPRAQRGHVIDHREQRIARPEKVHVERKRHEVGSGSARSGHHRVSCHVPAENPVAAPRLAARLERRFVDALGPQGMFEPLPAETVTFHRRLGPDSDKVDHGGRAGGEVDVLAIAQLEGDTRREVATGQCHVRPRCGARCAYRQRAGGCPHRPRAFAPKATRRTPRGGFDVVSRAVARAIRQQRAGRARRSQRRHPLP